MMTTIPVVVPVMTSSSYFSAQTGKSSRPKVAWAKATYQAVTPQAMPTYPAMGSRSVGLMPSLTQDKMNVVMPKPAIPTGTGSAIDSTPAEGRGSAVRCPLPEVEDHGRVHALARQPGAAAPGQHRHVVIAAHLQRGQHVVGVARVTTPIGTGRKTEASFA